MRTKQNTWKDGATSSKLINNFKLSDPFVKQNGIWVPEKKLERPEVVVFATNSTGDSVLQLFYGFLKSASPIYLKCYDANGALQSTVSLSRDTQMTTANVFPTTTTTEIRLESDSPVSVGAGHGEYPFFFSSQSRITEILYFHKDKYQIEVFPAVQGTSLAKVPAVLPKAIKSLAAAFQYCPIFNQDISGWDTKNVTNMAYAFRSATAFAQNISSWDVANVTSWASFSAGSGMTAAQIPPKFR